MTRIDQAILPRVAETASADEIDIAGESAFASRKRASAMRAESAGRLPIGSINIDLDTLRDYAPGYGFTYERDSDPVYTHALPRFLDLLERMNVPTTLFVIGRDAANSTHAKVLRGAFASGHEPGNHTMTHPRRMSKLSTAALRRELTDAHEVITDIAERRPVGFRAPCYDLHRDTLPLLNELGYRYDSSVHPTILGPVVDAAVLVKSRGKSREWRPGTYAHAFAPLRPYRANAARPWLRSSKGKITELPLSAVPWTRMPFYGTWAHATGLKRFDRSLTQIRSRGGVLNFHFHAIELLDMNDPGVDARFRVHPGMAQPLAERANVIEYMIGKMKESYELVTLAEYAERAVLPCKDM